MPTPMSALLPSQKVRESSRQDEEGENVEDPESEENEDGEITE